MDETISVRCASRIEPQADAIPPIGFLTWPMWAARLPTYLGGRARSQELQDGETAEEVTIMIVLIGALYRWWTTRQAKRLAADDRRTTL